MSKQVTAKELAEIVTRLLTDTQTKVFSALVTIVAFFKVAK